MTGEELRKARVKTGLSQDALAKYLGYATITILKWETGEHRIPPWVDIAMQNISGTNISRPETRGKPRTRTRDGAEIVD